MEKLIRFAKRQIRRRPAPIIEDPYIAVEVPDQCLESLREKARQVLQSYGLSAELPERSAHVSLGYATGCETESRLTDLALRLAQSRMELRAKGMEILPGLTTPYDYVVLLLEEDEAFRRAREQIDAELPTRQMPGGFRAHVTLLRIPKASVGYEAANGQPHAADTHGTTVPHTFPSKPPPVGRELESVLDHALVGEESVNVRGEMLAVFDRGKCCRIQCRMAASH